MTKPRSNAPAGRTNRLRPSMREGGLCSCAIRTASSTGVWRRCFQDEVLSDDEDYEEESDEVSEDEEEETDDEDEIKYDEELNDEESR